MFKSKLWKFTLTLGLGAVLGTSYAMPAQASSCNFTYTDGFGTYPFACGREGNGDWSCNNPNDQACIAVGGFPDGGTCLFKGAPPIPCQM